MKQTVPPLRRLLARYRPLVLGQARLRLCGLSGRPPHRAFWAFLAPPNDPMLVDMEVTGCMRPGHDECKDRVVEEIREHAKQVKAPVVWFCARGWTAPDRNVVRPSLDPRRRHVVLVFESTASGDSTWTLPVSGLGRWTRGRSDGGRFLGLVGERRRLVEMAKYRKGGRR